MARRRKKKSALDAGKAVEGGAEMDMTPMIDITFQLIVFFLVANDLSKKEIEELELPQAIYGEEDLAKEKDRRVFLNIMKPDDVGNPPEIPDIRFKGQQYDLETLKRRLRTEADMKREAGPGSPSAVYVLVRADRNTPWSHVQYVMQVCADPTVQIYKMQFATTKRDDGKATQGSGD